jgi:hypothetical protein
LDLRPVDVRSVDLPAVRLDAPFAAEGFALVLAARLRPLVLVFAAFLAATFMLSTRLG